MESAIALEIVTAGVAAVLMAILGWIFQRMGGKKGWAAAALLGFGTVIASGFCIAGTAIGYSRGGARGAWIGLIIGMVPAVTLVPWFLGSLIKGNSRRFLALTFFALFVMCALGYGAGGWLGLLTLTLPSLVIFWLVFARIADYVLPPRTEGRWSNAFRCLLTFTMGTNYPYFFVQDGQVETRVSGNPFLQFLAGPGMVYADCDQAAYVTTTAAVSGIVGPGLTFTRPLERGACALDLRPQYREFQVHALTRDAIPIRVQVRLAFRLRSGGQQVELERSFPFRYRTLHHILSQELVEGSTRDDEDAHAHCWDASLVQIVATPVAQKILSRRCVDDLCAALDPPADPEAEIGQLMQAELRRALWPRGIELIDCRIGNLVPTEKEVVQRRLDNWRTEWEQRIFSLMHEGQAERTEQMRAAQTEAKLEVVLRLIQVIGSSTLADEAAQIALALRFIDSLGDMVGDSGAQWPVPASMEETLDRLRGSIVVDPGHTRQR